MNFRYKFQRFVRGIAIPNLMTYIVITMGIVFIGDMVSNYMISGMFAFERQSILEGQIWRVITFLGIPDTHHPMWIFVSLMFYYSIGRDLEAAWGSGNLTRYLLVGFLLTAAGGFVTGATFNSFLYLSMFLAYAMIMPNNIFMIFFIIPCKAKWLAAADAAYILLTLIFSPFLSMKIAALAALGVFVIFFGKDFLRPVINRIKHKEFFHEMRRKNIKMNKRK